MAAPFPFFPFPFLINISWAKRGQRFPRGVFLEATFASPSSIDLPEKGWSLDLQWLRERSLIAACLPKYQFSI